MSSEPIDILLAKLTPAMRWPPSGSSWRTSPTAHGGPSQVVAHFTRKFDSMDIVQSVWADLLAGLRQGKWIFRDVEQLRAFLLTMTRHRFIDRLRTHRTALDREVAMEPQEIEGLPAAAPSA